MSPKLAMNVNDHPVNVAKVGEEDYICLTDMAKSAGADRALHSWLRTKNTIDFLGFWEQLNNTDFKVHEFVYFKTNAGANSFNPSVQEWIDRVNAIGIITKRGRYGGTYAHRDIAFEFGTWLSPEFKLLVITEFQRLKATEQKQVQWDSRRYLTKVNYRLHTDSIRDVLLPSLSSSGQLETFAYTSEADMLNRIVFGQTAAEWRAANPDEPKSSNQRDQAKIQQLVLLANLESLNAHLIANHTAKPERIGQLLSMTRRHYQSQLDQENAQAQFERGEA